MLPEFIAKHGDELIARAREKVATRAFPRSTQAELGYGVPLFLTQLAAILRGEAAPAGAAERAVAIAEHQANGRGEIGLAVAVEVRDQHAVQARTRIR